MEEHERGGRHSADGAMPAAEGKTGNRSKMQGDDPSRTGLDSALSSAPPQPPSVAANHQNDFSPYFLAAAAAAAASAQAEAAARSSVSKPTSMSAAIPRPYTSSRSPFLMSSTGSQAVKEFSEETSRSQTSRKNVDRVRCSWAILSTKPDDLRFLYADPTLRRSISKDYDDISFFNYIHPEDQKRTRADMKNIIDSRTLFGSVTRCRFRPSSSSSSSSSLSSSSTTSTTTMKGKKEADYTAIDIVVNWVGDDMALCFFHAIVDESARDNDEVNKTSWSNWCGIEEGGFGREECQEVWSSIQSHRGLKATATGPSCVFQILSAVPSMQKSDKSGTAATPLPPSSTPSVLFSWPPPRLTTSSDGITRMTSSAAVSSTNFADGSYSIDDFARLAQGVDKLTMQKELSDASTSCTRRFRAKHTLTTEGMLRSVESVLIPYGSIVLACFRVTSAQVIPGISEGGAIGPTASSSSAAILQESSQGGDHQSLLSLADQEAKKYNTNQEKRHHQQVIDLIPAAVVMTTRKAVRTRGGAGDEISPDSALASSSLPSPSSSSSSSTMRIKSCQICGKTDSPEWRKGKDGTKSLCNACGLRFSRTMARTKKKEERAKLANEVLAKNGGIIPIDLLKKAQLEKEEQENKKRKRREVGGGEGGGGKKGKGKGERRGTGIGTRTGDKKESGDGPIATREEKEEKGKEEAPAA